MKPYFFDNPSELKVKIKSLLNNKKMLIEIAENGYKKCLENKCSWDHRVKEACNNLIESKII